VVIITVERSSRQIDEFMATAGVSKGPVENKPGDTSILRVIEAYCASGKGMSNIRKSTVINAIMYKAFLLTTTSIWCTAKAFDVSTVITVM